jgi:phage protein|nr:MAG TPA: hypothetical protein [Caudoviricetes sp.]
MFGAKLRQIDQELAHHQRAWLNREVERTEERGKKQYYVYSSFKDFFDYEKELKLLNGEEVTKIQDKELGNLLLKANT